MTIKLSAQEIENLAINYLVKKGMKPKPQTAKPELRAEGSFEDIEYFFDGFSVEID